MTCTKCQSQIPADAVYCPACGADAPTDPGPEAVTQPMRASSGSTAKTVLAQLAESLGANYQVRRVVGRGGSPRYTKCGTATSSGVSQPRS